MDNIVSASKAKIGQFVSGLRKKLTDQEGFIQRNPQTGRFSIETQNVPTYNSTAYKINNLQRAILKPIAQVSQNLKFAAENPATAGRFLSQTINQTPILPSKLKQGIGSFVANTGQTVFSGIGDITKGQEKFAQGGNINKISGGAQMLRGLGKVAIPFVPSSRALFSGANVISSIPQTVGPQDFARRLASGLISGMSQEQLAKNVPDVNLKLNIPVVGKVEFDPLKVISGMVGYVKNPINEKFFKLTEKIIPSKGNLGRWLATTATRGGVENIALNLPELDTNISPQNKAQWFLTNFGAGAVQEIVGRGVLKGIGKTTNLIKATNDILNNPTALKKLSNSYDKLSSQIQSWKTPITKYYSDIKQNITAPAIKHELGIAKSDEPIGGKAEPKPKYEAKIKVFVTKQDKQQLLDLGYKKEQINKMKPSEVQNILSGKTTQQTTFQKQTEVKPEPVIKPVLTKNGKIKVQTTTPEVKPPDVIKQTQTKAKIPPTGGKPPFNKPSANDIQSVSNSIDDRINSFLVKTAGYSTKIETPKQKFSLLGILDEAVVKLETPIAKLGKYAESKLSKAIEVSLGSQNSIVRNASKALHSLFRGLGTSSERAAEISRFKGGIAVGNQRSADIQDSLYKIIGNFNNKQSLERVNAVLDPEIAKTKITFKQLTPQEKELYTLLKEGFDLVHDISYTTGRLPYDKWVSNKGKYAPRLYEEFEIPAEINKFVNSSPNKLINDIYKAKKEVNDWRIENNLNDPVYAFGKRFAQVTQNQAVKRYFDFVASNPEYISDVPRVGFTKLSDASTYGSLKGKYVLDSVAEDIQGFFYTNDLLQKTYDVFRAYDRLPLRTLQKKLLTVFNPTTAIGNVTTNNVFGYLTGINPLSLNKNVLELVGNRKQYKTMVDYLMARGVVGTDITRSDFTNSLGTIDDIGIKKGKIKQVLEIPQKLYGAVDDLYKAAAFKTLIERGESIDNAVDIVLRGFQNYSNVGKLYDFASKTPLFGQPFIKFQGDLIRIIKNGLLTRPLHTMMFLGALSGIGTLASKWSGETDDERARRESRFGTNQIPGLNIPLNWQTPFGEIDIARYIAPFYTTQLKQNEVQLTLGKLLPFFPEVAYNENGEVDRAKTWALNSNDPFLSTLSQYLTDYDFRGIKISDPKASPFFGSDLPQEEQDANKMSFLIRGYLPPQINSLIDVYNAAKDAPDRYGRELTLPQSLLRAAGIKVQDATPEVVNKQLEKSMYFDSRNEAFKKLNSFEKSAVKAIPKQDPDDIRAKMSKYQTFLQYPAVFNYFKEIAINQNQGDVTKIDPLYLFPNTDTYYYNFYQSKGGSALGDAEAKQLYEAYPVIGTISKARAEFYKRNPIEDSEMRSTTRPIPTERVQSLMNQGVWSDAEVQQYLELNRDWKNANRLKEGLPPLDKYGNVLNGSEGGGSFARFRGGSRGGARTKKAKKVAKITVKKGRVPKGKGFKIRKLKIPKIKEIKTPRLKVLPKTKRQKIKVKTPKFKVRINT